MTSPLCAQVVWASRDNTEREAKLVEIGPRFVLIPVSREVVVVVTTTMMCSLCHV
jgi:hypothetical protein